MSLIRILLTGLIATLLIPGCSTTTLTGSWKDPDYSTRIDNVYIVGISKNDSIRRVFEDQFDNRFRSLGIRAMVSYKDFSSNRDVDKDVLMDKALARGSETLLLTRMISRRTETVVTPGRITGYATGPDHYDRFYPYPHYRTYGTYWSRRYETIYEPPTVTEFKVATIESNLYDAETGQLIWTAQLETTFDGKLQKRVNDFIEVVIADMKEKNLI